MGMAHRWRAYSSTRALSQIRGCGKVGVGDYEGGAVSLWRPATHVSLELQLARVMCDQVCFAPTIAVLGGFTFSTKQTISKEAYKQPSSEPRIQEC
jgi:hypothetical protein